MQRAPCCGGGDLCAAHGAVLPSPVPGLGRGTRRAAPGRGHVLGGRWRALTSLQFSDLEKWTRSSLYISWVLMTSLYSFWLRSSGLMPLALRNSW